MTREIKSRAWDGEKMFAFDLHTYMMSNEDHQDDLCPPYGEVRNTLMQYTGLKDKNGVEIYEGDIVTDGTWASDNEFYKGVVTFLNGCFVTTCKNDCMSGNHVFGWNHLIDDLGLNVIEVIGNIYENPELIKTETA